MKRWLWLSLLLLAVCEAGCNSPELRFREGMRAFADGDYDAARARLEPLAIEGHAGAQYQVGLMYAEGIGVARDASTAAGLYREAAQQGEPAAQYYLSRMYEAGSGVPQDPRKAFLWMQRLAEQGFAPAAHEIGQRLSEGQGAPVDAEAAREWNRRATEAGYPAGE